MDVVVGVVLRACCWRGDCHGGFGVEIGWCVGFFLIFLRGFLQLYIGSIKGSRFVQ